jgi:hypothetical protein
MKFLEASHTSDEMSLYADYLVSYFLPDPSQTHVRLWISSTFCLLLLSQNLISPSLPAVATTLLGASFALSRHVTFSFTFAMTPSGRKSEVWKRNESSEEMNASWSVSEYVSGSCCGAVDMIL